MKRHGIRALALALAVGLVAAGCGDDDDGGEGGEALSKEEYIAQANEICEEGTAELESVGEDIGANPSEEEFDAFVTDDLVPNLRGQIDDLREGIPAGDEEQVNAILDDAEGVLDELEADPAKLRTGDDPFADVNRRLNEYGLVACGG